MWDKIVIATKIPAVDVPRFWDDLHTSLRMLRRDHIDIFQFHNPPISSRPGDDGGLYDAMLEAKQEGKIRFIGMTNHRLDVAWEAINSGLYLSLIHILLLSLSLFYRHGVMRKSLCRKIKKQKQIYNVNSYPVSLAAIIFQ